MHSVCCGGCIYSLYVDVTVVLAGMYWCNLARYWLQAVWGWHDSVETCSGVTICEIVVCICWFKVQNNSFKYFISHSITLLFRHTSNIVMTFCAQTFHSFRTIRGNSSVYIYIYIYIHEAYSNSKYRFVVRKSSKVLYKILLLSDSTFFKLIFHIFAAIIEALIVAGHKFLYTLLIECGRLRC